MIIKIISFIIIILIFTSCMDSSTDARLPVTHCIEDLDCLDSEICEATYCVSSKIEQSKARFTLQFNPTNNINNLRYYHRFKTDIISGEELVKNDSFTLSVSNYIELSGEIKNNQGLNITYSFVLYDKDNGIRFYGHSYKEGEKTLYYFKIPLGNYILDVFPESYYPTFSINLNELKELNNNYPILVDREINPENYSSILGTLKLKIDDDSIYTPNEYTIYAYIDNNNSEKVISNKFSCNKDCRNFNLSVLSTNEKVYLKVKVNLLEDLTFRIPVDDLGTSLEDVEIDLGNFYKSKANKLILSGVCDDGFKNLEIKVKGNLNDYTIYENNFTCIDKECSNFNLYEGSLYEGSFNIFIKPGPESCYVSKFLNIKLSREPSEIKVELKKKKEIAGILMSKDGLPVEGVIKFTRKYNSLTDFKLIANSDESGNFKAYLEPGEYDILIEPVNSSISYSNWLYLNQRITVNTDSLLYIIPKSYKVPATLYTQNNEPLASAQVTMSLHDLVDVFSNENGYGLPESYIIDESITDTYGKFILSIPIINDEFLEN